MEQYQDFKSELQQELKEMQQQMEQHSKFNSEVWRRTVRQHTHRLYRLHICSSIILLVVIVACSLAWWADGTLWPWWLLLLVDLFMIYIIVYSLVTSRGMYRPDVHSKDGLLSLRESVKKNTDMNKTHKRIIQLSGAVLAVLLLVFAYKNRPDLFSGRVIGAVAGLFAGLFVARRLKGHYKDLSEEIDELLKEE